MDKLFTLLFTALVVLAAVPAPVAADETRAGGTVVVEEGETVNESVRAFGGTVVVRGTVNGDLSAMGGNVNVEGRVNGDLQAASGNVRINGTVTGDVSAAGGNVVLSESGRVGGQLDAGAGSVVLDGEVGGDAQIGADTITLGPTAVIGGDLTYDGNLDRADGARVAGEIRQDSSPDAAVGPAGLVVPKWLAGVYGFLANLVLGAILLLAFPRFSNGTAERAADNPLRSGGIGLLSFVGIPVLFVLLLISLVGIPLGLLVVLLYPLVLWVGYVYGAFSLGAWGLGLADTDSRWLALAAGLLAVSVVGFVPILGGIVQFLVLLVGVGAFALGAWRGYRGRGTRSADSGMEML
ncbi:polymer-forming cytoskeletal protein [Halorussus sp. MSC15.2]|uniref:polymer-forming cytoskeletal protein n=1 Tax=Halorussus sp. MSC15.2 TaxID=2283638 RepID=UPI0013D63950|nr:polymer-forming cytoskeletal protein [Halorussus sp. MSC15.2]NEU55393.1 polymer-forming cytoskeletal protein [Halorussus sp. MSC15.2]